MGLVTYNSWESWVRTLTMMANMQLTSNFAVEAEMKVDVLIIFMFWTWNILYVQNVKNLIERVMTYQLIPFQFFFSANSLYCSSKVENDKKIYNSLTSMNFSLKLLYTCLLYLDKENVAWYKFMLLRHVFSSMQINKNAFFSLNLRLGTFFACFWHLGQFQPQRSYKKKKGSTTMLLLQAQWTQKWLQHNCMTLKQVWL